MKRTSPVLYAIAILFSGFCAYSCANNSKDDDKPKPDSARIAERKKVNPKPENRPPIVNIVDTLVPKTIIIYVKDSAATFERISLKLGTIYGVKLPLYIKKNNLKTGGAPMAWYKKQPAGSYGKAPYFFEAGVPVNKKGSKAVAGVLVREMAAGKAVIAHFFGPFELLPQGYDAVKEWMKDNKKTAAGAPYEIYITDPMDKNGKPVDAYKIQTDIVFPIK
ncbi:MAG: GyrI-like domain-containing protein [Ferruginibacter sp.]